MSDNTERLPGRPDVSVIIPALNEAGAIGDVVSAVGRVLQRRGCAFEILVVDDGSHDETSAIAEAAGAQVIHHPYNIGNGAATTQFVIFNGTASKTLFKGE